MSQSKKKKQKKKKKHCCCCSHPRREQDMKKTSTFGTVYQTVLREIKALFELFKLVPWESLF